MWNPNWKITVPETINDDWSERWELSLDHFGSGAQYCFLQSVGAEMGVIRWHFNHRRRGISSKLSVWYLLCTVFNKRCLLQHPWMPVIVCISNSYLRINSWVKLVDPRIWTFQRLLPRCLPIVVPTCRVLENHSMHLAHRSMDYCKQFKHLKSRKQFLLVVLILLKIAYQWAWMQVKISINQHVLSQSTHGLLNMVELNGAADVQLLPLPAALECFWTQPQRSVSFYKPSAWTFGVHRQGNLTHPPQSLGKERDQADACRASPDTPESKFPPLLGISFVSSIHFSDISYQLKEHVGGCG